MNFMTNNSRKLNQLIKLQKVLIEQNIPFVSYKLPLETDIVTLVQHHSIPEVVDMQQFTFQQPGFIIAPFVTSDKHQSYFLRPDCIFFADEIDDIYIEKLAANNRFLHLSVTDKCTLETTTEEEFTDNVNNAIVEMNAGNFRKVVLSKVRKETLPENFDAIDFFMNLCNKYPHALVYMARIPEVGFWMGATPEPLLEIEGKKASTVSLAGTQLATNKTVNEYEWSVKELDEQKIVTDFVENTLQQFGVTNIHKSAPENYQAAQLIHLKTAFEFSSMAIEKRFGKILGALHPTPSVGGLPKTAAKDFILNNEKHERSYYTGFLGPINIEEKSNLFVNLRCLQLFDKEFVLYSGAGITASSIAEKEWIETDNKMMTLMNVMNYSKK